MLNEGAIGLAAQYLSVSRGHDEKPPVGQEVDAHRERGHLRLDRGAAIGRDREDAACTPVGEPEPPFVPARRLPEHDAFHDDVHDTADRTWNQKSSEGTGHRTFPTPTGHRSQDRHAGQHRGAPGRR